MVLDDDIVGVMAGDIIAHYGILERSGRYPWGSGENPYQRLQDFSGAVGKMRKEGMSDTDIAKALGMSTTTLRSKLSLAKEEKRAADAALALRLKEKGYSNVAIAERMGLSGESQVRSLLKHSESVKKDTLRTTADMLKKEVDEKGCIDVGAGVELYLGISRSRMTTAIDMLKDEGYKVYWVPVEQMGTGKYTNLMCVAKPDSNFYDIKTDTSLIKPIGMYSEDGGATFEKLGPPKSVSSDRVMVRFDEDGGTMKDGLIELRRGVDDISLGDARYAQVRIGVDGTHYLKGMAVYSDNMPDGVDIIFNTNKSRAKGKMGAMKEMGPDPENPFSSAIKNDSELILAQRHYIDKDGKRQQSCLNIVNEEGNWGEWSSSLASQFLSKQNLSLVKSQLNKALSSKIDEFKELSALNQPLVKKKLMESFAEDCDAASVHLKAAGLPRQGSHVIIPFPKMKENEIYAPNYQDGESVVLIRYPHGGKFEIPELVVNNKFAEAKKVLGNAPDAVGINHKVAERLSGADFDGDTVLVIPNNTGAVKTSPALAGLKGFDPKAAYPAYEGMARMTPKQKAVEMGKVSNLITDMTIKNASLDEIARAVRHSMVVIDAEKHYLNYEQSYKDNGIAKLQEKYQGKAGGGASTLISKAKSTQYIKERKEGVLVKDPVTGMTRRQFVDPKTGEKLYEETGGVHYKKVETKTKGTYWKEEPNQEKVSLMSITKDARTLSSGTKVEEAYASYANELKSLANKARLEALNSKMSAADPQAKKTYAPQVKELKTALEVALKNAPLERQAQIVANAAVKARKEANPAMEPDSVKKAKGQELVRARQRLGAAKQRIKITDEQWKAIQSGAVSPTTLDKILDNCDMNEVKKLATPRQQQALSSSTVSRIKAMVSNGYTQAEIANALGISASTVTKYA